MTEMNDSTSGATKEEDRIAEEEEAYVPPDHLPPPPGIGQAAASGSPLLPFVFGLVAAGVSGAALYAVGQLFYIYILYNFAAGAAVGWAISFGARKAGYGNGTVLTIIALLCSIGVYLTYNLAMYAHVLGELEPGAERLSFGQFLLLRAELEPFIGDIEPGIVGNVIVWIVELGITAYYAWTRTRAVVVELQLETVPMEVIRLVVHYLSEGKDESGVRGELSRRGWMRPEDQERALHAAGTLLQVAGAAEEK